MEIREQTCKNSVSSWFHLGEGQIFHCLVFTEDGYFYCLSPVKLAKGDLYEYIF